MKFKKFFAAALACLAIGPSQSWGQCATWTSNTIRNCNGLDYELWSELEKDGSKIGTATMNITGGSTDPNGGTFEADWDGTLNVLFRAGKKWGANSTTTPKAVGNITLDFAATWTSNDGAKMLGIYGWAYYPSGSNPTRTESGQNMSFSNQIEYYIIQDRGSFNPASGGTNAKKYGEGTIDEILYEFWVADRIDQAMLTGKGNFKQYFSVPKNTSSHRRSGKVSISKHFEAWEKAGMRMMDCALYEVAMKVESYTYSRNGKGNAKVTKNLLTLGGGNGDEFSLVANVSPVGAGTVAKSPSTAYYAPNSTVQLTATPSTGWKFVGWEGDATGTASATSVTMSKDKSVTAKFALVSGDGTTNLLKDGNFPSSSVIAAEEGASWRLAQGEYWGNSVATSSVSNGTATIDVTTLGEETYQPQLVQYGVSLDEGMNYKLTFKAKAEVARKIEASVQMASDPWTGYASKEFDLTTTEQTYEFVFTMDAVSDPASQFAFNLGQALGEVSISDVKLVHTSSGPSAITRGIATLPTGSKLVSVHGRTLSVLPVEGTTLRIQVVDLNGRVKASFDASSTREFQLSQFPAGQYFLNVSGSAAKQSLPIVLN